MFDPTEYALLDFGRGRRLERFGRYTLDRPYPPAERIVPCNEAAWRQVDARFERVEEGAQGLWWGRELDANDWMVRHNGLCFGLKPTDAGHLGLFPEQAGNWDWIERQVQSANRPLRVLNLFAYTGGSTLAAAQAGAEVVHVDAAKNVVSWARRNAEGSQLAEAPIRWIVDDARKFVRREQRREQRYDAMILDPPSFGHGPRGEVWSIKRHLLPLIRGCRRLLSERPAFFLITCHTTGVGPAELTAYVSDGLFGHCGPRIRSQWLHLVSTDGRKLRAGVMARWSALAQGYSSPRG